MNSIALEPAEPLADCRQRPSPEVELSPAPAEVVIEVNQVSKCYRLYKRPQDRLKQALCLGRRKYFDEFWALRDVNFQLRRGETIGVIGRNGSGKSTLLQIICGILQPTSGGVNRQGRVAALLELGAGFNPEFTGRENVFLNAAIMGVPHDEIAVRLNDILDFADIGEHIDQPVKTYSSGMFVRLAFAVIAHIDADILIVDEALSVGDAFFSQKCMRFLRKFRDRGTILFVSHDTGSVVNLCSSAIWLDRGQVCDAGPAKQVCEAYLASYYESLQGPHALRPASAKPSERKSTPRVDQRLKYLNHSQYRNDLKLYEFNDGGAAFGKGLGRVTSAQLLDDNNQPLSWLVGGETVTLAVEARAEECIGRPIVGFLVKDRLGQVLFSDNTCLSHALTPVPLEPGDTLEARFTFQMPILPMGDYSITLSLAEGTQEEHVQHHWIHDAILFKSLSSSVCTGLVGIPMLNIEMTRGAPNV